MFHYDLRRAALAVLLFALLGATAAYADESAPAACPFDEDRRAILSMAGAYRVDFHFRETVALRPGYELHEPHDSGAREWVEVVEDAGDRIVLQHVLLVGDHVVKHWRQDWTYQDGEILEFRGGQRWEPMALAPERAAGTWTQRVSQVADSPRYEGYGRWVHRDGLSSWESNETWRPLPRREYTTRSDYDVLVGRNRHTLTPTGWVHEQDNYKLALDPEKRGDAPILAREVGLNTYDRIDESELQPARDYWREAGRFWADVRGAWADVHADGAAIELRAKVDGKPLHRHLFDACDEFGRSAAYDSAQAKERVRQIIDRFVVVPEAARAGAD